MDPLIRTAILAIARSGAVDMMVPSGERLAATLCATFAAALLAVSVGCTSAALWIWAVPRFGPVGAPLAVAASLLVLGLAALLLMRHLSRSRRAACRSNPPPDILLAEAMRVFKDHKGSVLLAALMAGLAAGRSER